jgi:hypothetical protein
MYEIDDQPGLAILISALGEVTRVQGEQARAAALFQEGLRLSHRFGSKQGIAMGLNRLATLALERGECERAVRLCAAAEALPEAVRAIMMPMDRAAYDDTTVAVRALLDEPAFAAAWAEGSALPLDQAIDLALEPTAVESAS